MAVRLRLRRVGRKKLPIYKVVAADSRSPRDGRFIEAVGQYEPLRKKLTVDLNEERVLYWLKNGAQPSDTVRNLLQNQGIWLKWSLLKKGADERTITERLEKFKIERADKDKRAEEKAAARKESKKKEPAEAAEGAEPATTETPVDAAGETPVDTAVSNSATASESPAENAGNAPSTETPADNAADAPSTETPADNATDAPTAETPADNAADAPSKEEDTPSSEDAEEKQ